VKEIRYILSGGAETVVEGGSVSIPLTAEGIHSISYFAVDMVGNTEAGKSVTVRLDTSAPEAFVQFDQMTKDLLTYGIDLVSGVPGGPGTTVSAAPVKKNGKEVRRTVVVGDNAGNSVTLMEDVETGNQNIKGAIVTIKYKNGAAIGTVKNQISAHWVLNKDGSIKHLDQTADLGQGKSLQKLKAKYDGKKNQTTIIVEKGFNASGNSPQSSKKIVMQGLILIQLATNNGGVGD